MDESFGFLKGLIKPSRKKTHEVLAKESEDLVSDVLKHLKLKYHLGKKEKSTDGYLFRHIVRVDKKEYVIKSYLIFDTEYFSACIWSKDQQNLLHVMTIGFMKDAAALKSVAKERLKKWINQ